MPLLSAGAEHGFMPFTLVVVLLAFLAKSGGGMWLAQSLVEEPTEIVAS
jgi:hypothetical protein